MARVGTRTSRFGLWLVLCALSVEAGAETRAAEPDADATALAQKDLSQRADDSEAFVVDPMRSGVVLRLEEAERIAQENHPSLRRARAERAQAAAGVEAARAPLLPQVQARGSWQYQDRPGLQFTGPFIRNRNHTFSVGLSAEQLVTDFGRTTNRLRASAASERSQRHVERDVELAVLANVRQAFFNARAQKALVAVARRTLENQERHLEQVSAFVELGERPPYDLAQAQTNVGSARARLASAEGSYRIARAALLQAMGVTLSTDFDVADDTLPPVPGEEREVEELLPEALTSRPDLAALEEQIQAQIYNVRASRAGYFPIVGLSGGVSEIGPAIDELDGPAWVAGAVVTWPLFQGGATRASVRQAEALSAALAADLDTLTQRARFEIEEALAAIRSALAAGLAADQTVVSAREQLRLATGRYETGLGSLLELSDAELALQEAEASQVQAEYDLASARALLLERLGRLR